MNQFARKLGKKCFIAGGINAFNIENLLPYKPGAIDISGGIETNGTKDYTKIIEIERKIIL